jgi:BCD family chlorophyll transporter-like MFS transporter
MWILMILGFAVTGGIVGHFLDPFSAGRLVRVIAVAAGAAFLVALLAVWRVEAAAPAVARRRAAMPDQAAPGERAASGKRAAPGERGPISFSAALRQVWQEPEARAFTVFVFLSMLAYSAQELMLEPFAGVVFGYSPGESARLSSLGHSGALLGMVTVGIACSLARGRFASIRAWTVGGCLASAAALLGLAAADLLAPAWPLRSSVVALGIANGAFTVAAISSMMELSQQGAPGRAGVRMGLWGAAQAVAFALGGLVSTALVDLVRYWLGSPTAAFGIVFSVEAAMFGMAALCAAQVDSFKNRGAAATTVVSL